MTATSAARARILIADDNEEAAQALQLILELDGFEVTTALNGRDALMAAEVHHPDVFILDIGMPGLTGLQLASEIRRRPWGSHPYLIALTAWDNPGMRLEARRRGFNCFLAKPFNPAGFADILQDALKSSDTDVESPES